MNNITNVKNVIKTTLRERQLMIFSATINEKNNKYSKRFYEKCENIAN